MAIPSTAPHPAGVRARRASAPQPAGGNRSRPARELFATLGGLFLGPVSRAGTAVEVPASRGKLRRSRPGEQFLHPLGGLFFNPGFASRRRGRHACRGKLWTQSVRGMVRHPSAAVPSGSAWMSNSPPAVLGSSRAPDQVPDSVTDIDRPAAGADPPRGHDAPLLLVDLSNGEFSTPAVGSSVRRLAMPQEGPLTLLGDLGNVEFDRPVEILLESLVGPAIRN